MKLKIFYENLGMGLGQSYTFMQQGTAQRQDAYGMAWYTKTILPAMIWSFVLFTENCALGHLHPLCGLIHYDMV